MALFVMGAFATGVAAGWLVRGSASSARDALVNLVAASQHARDHISRILGQAIEWSEDLIAEGTVHYERTKYGEPELSSADESKPMK